jgi:hypothetical protein
LDANILGALRRLPLVPKGKPFASALASWLSGPLSDWAPTTNIAIGQSIRSESLMGKGDVRCGRGINAIRRSAYRDCFLGGLMGEAEAFLTAPV